MTRLGSSTAIDGREVLFEGSARRQDKGVEAENVGIRPADAKVLLSCLLNMNP